MRAYKVIAKFEGDVVGTRFAGTAADSKTKRDELMEQFDIKKKDVEIEDCEIPTAKAELLDFINEVAATGDMVFEEGADEE